MNRRLANLEDRKKELNSRIDDLLGRTNNDGDLCAADEEKYHLAQGELKATNDAILGEHQTHPHYAQVPPINQFDDCDWANPGGATATANADVMKHGMIGAKYSDLFGKQLDKGGWPDMQSYLSQINTGLADVKLNALSEGAGPDGGFLVPTTFVAEQMDSAMENSIVMSRARIYPMLTNETRISGFDASTNTSGTLFAGVESQWLGEGDTASVTNPVVRQIMLQTKKLALLCTTSNEVAADGMNLNSQLSSTLGEANGWFLDYAFLRGDGVGMPLGALNDPALITVDKEAGQPTDTLLYENMINMLARLHVGCHQRAVWVCSPTLIPSLLTLFAPTALTGQLIPVVERLGGSWSMLGKEILFSEKMSTKGDLGDILLADFSQYAIGLRKEMTIEKSGHVYFTSDKTAWRAITRLDGQGRWNQAFTPANGDTQSWCVTLQAR